MSWTCPACQNWTIDDVTPGFVTAITEHMRKCAAAPAFVRETVGHMPPASLIDCNSPVAVCLEDAIETEAFELARAEFADFKRALETIAAILRPLPLDGARRVLIASATAVGFPEALIADFVRGMDVGIAAMFAPQCKSGDPRS